MRGAGKGAEGGRTYDGAHDEHHGVAAQLFEREREIIFFDNMRDSIFGHQEQRVIHLAAARRARDCETGCNGAAAHASFRNYKGLHLGHA